jgi:hypothetical protein
VYNISVKRGSVLEFRGRDDTGQVLKYSVFSRPLQAMIKPEVELTLDIVTSSRETPQGTFVNHKVVSVNGQSGIRQIFNGRTDSPETRASIEAMKAADIVSQLRIHGELADESALYRAALAWCHKALTSDNAIGVSHSVSRAIPTRLPEPPAVKVSRPKVASQKLPSPF